MASNIEKLDKLTTQEVAIRELLEKLELDIKISKATKNYELTDKYENEELGLAKLLIEIKIEKIQLTETIEVEERRIKSEKQIKVAQAKGAERVNAEMHIKAAKEFHRDGRLKTIFGLITLVGGCFFFNTSVVLALLIITCGFVLIYLGKQAHLGSEDEKLYAQGYSKDQLIDKKRKQKEDEERRELKQWQKNKDNEDLAKAIANELKK